MKNLIIITSVINITKNPLNYTKIRSIYNNVERYEQTLKTIESCEKIKKCKILFIETSNVCKEWEDNIKSKVDYYINLSYDLEVKTIVDGQLKGRGESIQILSGLKIIDLLEFDNVIKISGRYWFGDEFNYDNYDNINNVFKEGSEALGTAMYKIHKTSFVDYINCLNFCKESNGQIERDFANFFGKTHITYNKIGLEGYVSVDGNLINW